MKPSSRVLACKAGDVALHYSIPTIIVRFIHSFLLVIIFFLGLRFIFRLLAANPTTPFVAWVYDISSFFIKPFAGIYLNRIVGQGSLFHVAVFDIVSLITIAIYAVGAYLLVTLVTIITQPLKTSPKE